MSNFSNRRYLILDSSEIYKIDFDQILEDSAQSLSYSLDLSKSIIKWDLPNWPDFIQNITSAEGPYTYDQITNIVAGPGWSY